MIRTTIDEKAIAKAQKRGIGSVVHSRMEYSSDAQHLCVDMLRVLRLNSLDAVAFWRNENCIGSAWSELRFIPC